MNWKRQVNGEPSRYYKHYLGLIIIISYYLNSYSPIIHDLDEEKLYFAAHNEDQVHSSGHDIYAVNINNGTVAHTHRVGESVAFPFMIIGQI